MNFIFSFFFALAFPCVFSDPCPPGLTEDHSTAACATYTESMGCVFAELRERFDNYNEAITHCRDVMGPRARLAEIMSADDQATVVEVMKAAEAEIDNISTELTYWFSGLRDENDDTEWVWIESNRSAVWSNWNNRAVPEHSSYNCMQLLSGTDFGGSWMTFLCSNDYINTHPLCQLPN